MTRTLESDKLVRERHHATYRIIQLTIERVRILYLIVIVITHAAKPNLILGGLKRYVDRFVFQLFVTTDGELLAFLDNAYPRTGDVDIA